MTSHGPPENADIRAALALVIGSAGFRASPQLAAFLGYIVEAALRGKADRIKAHTIGVEALGRGHDFDPQRDPIVRVEANRLRQALQTYYAGAGAGDAVIIDIPRGRYVPIFRRRDGAVAPAAASSAPLWRRWNWRAAVTGAAVLILLSAVAIVWRELAADRSPSASAALGLAVLQIEPVQALTPTFEPLAVATSRELIKALSVIQHISVTADSPPSSGFGATDQGVLGGFKLVGRLEAAAGASANLTLRLEYDGVIAWTREWQVRADDAAAPVAVAREVAVNVGRMFGVMHAYVRAQADRLAPGYRCILAAAESLRKFDLLQHARVRDCLERTTADNPEFAIAFGLLAFVYEREYLHDLPARFGERPALERSLEAARHMLKLAPDTSVAHVAMMENLYIRGDIAGAFAAGEKALALNSLDPTVSGIVGLRFYLGGDSERGVALLEKAASRFGTNPGPIDFGLFCRAYMAGDIPAAARYAPRDDDSTFPYGLAAQALVAAAAGDHDRAKRVLQRLTSIYPGWLEPRTMLARFIHAPAIVDYLAARLAEIGRR